MKLEGHRKETTFTARDNMLDIWNHVMELCFRGFGKKKRKMPKEPKNFSEWSAESKQKWYQNQKELIDRQEYYDNLFIKRETEVLDNICREIVFLIDGANEIKPQYTFECDKIRSMQDDAIIKCGNLKRELNHIMRTIPSNKNFIVKLEGDIERELAILRGWRKSGNSVRQKICESELLEKKELYKKLLESSIDYNE